MYFHPLDFQYPPSVPAGLSNSLQCCLPSGLVGFVIKYTHLSSLQSGSALAFVVLLFLLSNNEAINVAFTRGVVGGMVEVVGVEVVEVVAGTLANQGIVDSAKEAEPRTAVLVQEPELRSQVGWSGGQPGI